MPASSTPPRKAPSPVSTTPALAGKPTLTRAKAKAGAKTKTKTEAKAAKRAAFLKHLLLCKGITFDRLWTLAEVHGKGSLIKAAGNNATRATQYSHQIGGLEEFFGFKISEPGSIPLALNRQGIELAQFTAEFFRHFADFTQRERGETCTFTIAAGESLLQWIVVPGLSALKRVYPDMTFRLRNLQNSDIVLGLTDMTLDFGLLRRESMRMPLKGELLGSVQYCLCVPQPLMAGLDRKNLRGLLEALPLAVHLETSYIQAEFEAATRDLKLKIRLRCDTFPNAMVALRTGRYATLMIQFPGINPLPAGVETIPLPFLDHTYRDIYLAWKPRLFKMRSEAATLKTHLAAHFSWQRDA